MPQVSVIITTYNRPEYLREAIRGVLNQTFREWELIVVDDASTNVGVREVIQSYVDQRIRHIRNTKNLGSARSLNVGLQAARGTYVAILDDDDSWVSEEKLERQVAFLTAHPDYVCVGTEVVVVDEESEKEIGHSDLRGDDASLRKRLLYQNPIAHSTAMFRNESVVRVGGYEEKFPRGKDYDLWLKLAQKGKIAVLPYYDVKYREASRKQRNILEQRYEDAKWTLEVIKKHRSNFRGGAAPYVRQYLRYKIFSILRKIPRIYTIYRLMKGQSR